MPEFRVGDHVSFNSESGRASGEIVEKHTMDVDYEGNGRRCPLGDPQVETNSDPTQHVTIQKADTLTKNGLLRRG